MRASGVVLLLGAGVFFSAAFAPASFVFGMYDPDRRRTFLMSHARSWKWVQLPFAAGAVISAAGLVVLGVEVDNAVVVTAGVVATLASLPWAQHSRMRAVDPEAFLEGRLPGWHFRVYVWGTLVPLLIVGVAVLGTEVMAWAAWSTVGWSLLLMGAWLRFGDVPPFLLYMGTGLLGIAVV